jgi:hypothetical protein
MLDKKNLRTIKIRVTAQTLWHLERLAALSGWGEKDLGRVVDKIIRTNCAEQAERKSYGRKRSKAD